MCRQVISNRFGRQLDTGRQFDPRRKAVVFPRNDGKLRGVGESGCSSVCPSGNGVPWQEFQRCSSCGGFLRPAMPGEFSPLTLENFPLWCGHVPVPSTPVPPRPGRRSVGRLEADRRDARRRRNNRRRSLVVDKSSIRTGGVATGFLGCLAGAADFDKRWRPFGPCIASVAAGGSPVRDQ